MKAHHSLMIVTLLLIASIGIFITSCKYDVAEPSWEKNYTLPSSPVISGVEPSEATPGVNTITIRGQNFVGISNNNEIVKSYVFDFM